jgi:hypothetical protein
VNYSDVFIPRLKHTVVNTVFQIGAFRVDGRIDGFERTRANDLVEGDELEYDRFVYTHSSYCSRKK